MYRKTVASIIIQFHGSLIAHDISSNSNIVFVFLTSEDVGKELEKSLNNSGLPGRTLFVKCDVSKQDQVQVQTL